jgi:hypothetical protein
MPDIVVPVGSTNAPRYRYYTADLVTNTIIGELSLEDVNYERSLKAPGSFDGKITITDQTNSLDLYNATMPGKTAIYAVRDGVCAWGGIIWGRTYDMVSRSLTFSASEFTSYLNHRIVWKAYSQSFEARLSKDKNKYVLVESVNKTLVTPPAVGDKVRVSFITGKLRKYTKNYSIVGLSSSPAAPSDPGQNSFYVSIPKLPAPPEEYYSGVTVTLKIDTYEYLRDLITNTLSDFENIQFPNEEITPGIRVPTTVTKKKLVVTDSYNGVATLTTDTPHNLILGQRVEISNVDPTLDGKYAVAEIPSPNTFTYSLVNPVSRFDRTSPILLANIALSNVAIQKTVAQHRQIVQSITENITHLKRISGVVTLQLNSQHRFAVGDKVKVFIEAKKPALQTENKKEVNSFDYVKFNNIVTITDITSDTITFTDPISTHSNSKYNRTNKDSESNMQSVENPAKNTVELANARPFLKVFPTGAGHGYAIGEQVQISGVDGYNAPWTNPIFDGYAQIYDVSPGTPRTINNYKIIVDPDITDNPIYQSDTLVYLYLGTTDPKFKAGDRLSVTGLDLDATSQDVSFLNGVHVIEDDSALGNSGVGNQYYVYFRFNWDTVAYKGAGAGGSASVDGGSWIAYEPAYSEIRYDPTLKEPDATSTISKIEYVPAKGASSNKVTVLTTDRHNLLVGDTVFVKYSKQEDRDLYGVSSATVLSVPDIDRFTYTVPKSPKSTTKKPIPSKKGTEGFVSKGGTATRLKSSIGAPQPVQVRFTEVHSTSSGQGGIVKLYSVDHGLSIGDSIIVDVDGAKDYLLENDKEPVRITDITQSTFSYKTNTDIPTIDKMEVRGFGFTTDGGQEVITFDLAQTDTRTARTNTITKVKPKWHKGVANDNYVTYTTSANTTAQVGDKVVITGLVDTGNTSTSITTVTSNVSSLEYYSTDKSLALTFATAHGLPADTGTSDPATGVNVNTVVLSGMPSTLTVILNVDYLQRRDLSGLNSKTLQVKKVVNSNTILISYNGGSDSFVNSAALSGISGVISNKNTVAVDRYSLSQFNVSGTVDYVAAATFSVKYNFLSGTEGNGVNPSGVIGTEYTLSPNNGTASFAARTVTNITANSIVSISGIADIKSSTTGKNIDYSKLNKTYRVLKVTTNSDYNKNANGTAASPTLDSIRMFVVNPLKTDDGEKTLRLPNYPYNGFDANYTDKLYPGLKNAKSEKWSKVSGTAYIDLGRLSADVYPISYVQRSSAANTVAVITAVGHGFEVGDFAEINIVGKSSAAFNQGGLPRQVATVPDEDTFTFNMTSPTKTSHYAIKDDVVTLFFTGRSPHNFIAGDTVTVSNLVAAINGSRVITSTGPYTISFRVTTADVDKKADIGTVAMATPISFGNTYRGSAVPGAFIKRVPTVFSRTYGEFPANAAIGDFGYSTEEYSGNSIENTPITGSSLNTVASILDKYSNGIGGFEYRVDCNLELDINGNKNFTKTFVLIPIYPTTMTEYLSTLPGGKLAVGQWAPPAAFGADKVIFEYPGNITNVNMTESAQDSATRVFVSSSGSSPGAAEIPYSAASDTTLLAAGWPLLDKKETATYPQANTADNKGVDSYGNYDIETDLNVSANKFLYESKPPQGDITIGVNGSLTPVVGSYSPGDWCSIIVNDDFVKNRLNSPLEPRNDVIVRRIDSIKVSVPNNPAFPEMIDLKLVPDWQVDSIGK